MEITLTCPKCNSAVELPDKKQNLVTCQICSHKLPVETTPELISGLVLKCPCCSGRDFYRQKDFNRKIGVLLFVAAAILSIWTYGISFIVLYLFDFLLFKKLRDIVICYKCQAVFRGARNVHDIPPFDHQTNDRIVYQ